VPYICLDLHFCSILQEPQNGREEQRDTEATNSTEEMQHRTRNIKVLQNEETKYGALEWEISVNSIKHDKKY